MPRLLTDDEQLIQIPGQGNYHFSAIRPENLGASEYTLVTIICDVSGSVSSFANALLECIKAIVESCKNCPRSENVLVRLTTFNGTIEEIHGFKNLTEINPSEYQELFPRGMTALFDATYNGVASAITYSKILIGQNYDVNAINYIITDGMDTQPSKMTPRDIKQQISNASQNEEVGSMDTILIGLHDPNSGWSNQVLKALTDFKDEANLSAFIDVGKATPRALAKLVNWVSQSVSSKSQALQTGGPSQILTF